MNPLGSDARALLRRAKELDEPGQEELSEVLFAVQRRIARQHDLEGSSRFETQSETFAEPSAGVSEIAVLGPRFGARRFGRRKTLVWLLAALVSSVSVGAWGAWSGALGDWDASKLVFTVLPPSESDAEVEQSAGRAARARSALLDEPVPGASVPEAEIPRAVDEPVPGRLDRSAPGSTELQPKPELPAPMPSELAGARSRSAKQISLAREVELIARARTALRAADYAATLALTRVHAHEFPVGQLSPERMAIDALARCHATGDVSAARAFVKRFPTSLFAGRVKGECRLSNSVSAPEVPATHLQDDSSQGSF